MGDADDCEQLRGQLQRARDKEAEVEHLHAQEVTALQSRISTLVDDLEDLRRKMCEADEERLRISDELTIARDQSADALAALKAHAELEATRTALADEARQLRADLDDMGLQRDALDQRLRQTQTEYDEMRRHAESVAQRAVAAEDNATQLQALLDERDRERAPSSDGEAAPKSARSVAAHSEASTAAPPVPRIRLAARSVDMGANETTRLLAQDAESSANHHYEVEPNDDAALLRSFATRRRPDRTPRSEAAYSPPRANDSSFGAFTGQVTLVASGTNTDITHPPFMRRKAGCPCVVA